MHLPHSARLLLSVFLLVATPALLIPNSASAASIDLAENMQQMKTAYRAALRSSNIADFNVHYQHLKQLTLQSSRQAYSTSRAEQQLYQQGFVQLQQDYQAIEQAIARQDLTAAKAALEKVRQTEKQYHQKLDV